MRKTFGMLVATLAALGFALGSEMALAQKAETPKTDVKKADAPKADAKKADAKADAAKPDAKTEFKADTKTELMDINSASEKELATLPGIGEARAKAIVKGRPYKGKDDLVKKKILTQKVYDDVKDKIIAKQDMAKDAPKDTKKK
jgi:competence protein ComEA